MNKSVIFKVIAAIALCVFDQSCSAIYETAALEAPSPSRLAACRENMGTYFLPKGELEFVVVKTAIAGTNDFRYDMRTGLADASTEGLSVQLTADQRHLYCIDYKANSLYSDLVRVQRTADGLLKSVYSNVEDQSKTIIENAAKGVALAVAAESRLANRDLALDTPAQIVESKWQFDPFDPELMTSVNQAIEKSGFCIYIDPMDDPFVPFWMRNQCTTAKEYVSYTSKGHAEEVFNTASFTAGEGRLGVLYKPALSHTLVILKRDDPTSGKAWRVWRRQIVEMPNRAPVFMLQVSRGFFTTRKTEISFNQGMLASIVVDKQSELRAVTDALVNVVGIVVQIPAKALIIGNNEAKNQEALIKANQTLLQSYSLLEAEQKKRANVQNGLQEDGTPRAGGVRARDACLNYADVSGLPNPESYCQDKAATQ
jgi:hypothetical protein